MSVSSGYWAPVPVADVYRRAWHIGSAGVRYEYRAVIPVRGDRRWQWEGPTRRGRDAEARARADLAAELELRQWLHDRRQETT